jgi:transposase-like protein
VWTWTAIDADTKLCGSYLVGLRDVEWAKVFMSDLASRLTGRIQLTTDGHRAYMQAVEGAFGWDIDYMMLVKLYGNDPSPAKFATARRFARASSTTSSAALPTPGTSAPAAGVTDHVWELEEVIGLLS